MNYSGVCYGPKPRPWIAPDTSWAPTAPYYGEKLAYLTSMTPFNKENFVPVLQESGVPDYLSFELGGWLLDTLDSVVGSTGIKTGLREGLGPNNSAVRKLQQGLILLGYGNLLAPQGDDGHYGGKTVSAVKVFQLSKGLPPTGEVDADTAQALNRAVAVKQGVAGAIASLPQGTESAPYSPPAPPPAPPPKMGMGLYGKIALVAVGLGVAWVAVKAVR